ncbi:hypothetical protein ABZ642_16980 [Streptomyces sp. NPDC007157]|uniref:hypothetical protein n=1 Tax=Streptomyces sp. NPDC007157 TaxID=3154681 RepID=UPI0033FFD088
MPAEHDGYDGEVRDDGHDGYGRSEAQDGIPAGAAGEADALLAVLLDEPLSDGQRADPGFMAEHRAAAADVALLRAQLGSIGDALAEPPRPEPRPRPKPRPRPRPWQHPHVRSLGLVGALAAAFVSAVFGIGWLTANGVDSKASDSSADSAAGGASVGASGKEALGGARYLACARLVVEGTVTGVRRLPQGGGERVTLKVTHAYKPAKTGAEVDVLFAAGADPRIRTGARLLVGVTEGRQEPDRYAVGEAEIAPERSWIVHDLPESRTLTCRE